MCRSVSGWPASSISVNETVSNAADCTDGVRTTRRTESNTSGRNVHVKPIGQRMKNESAVEYIQPPAAITATDSRHPSSRAKRNAHSPAMKNAMDAEYVRLFATG